jgi:hypothetical protein
MVEVSWTVLGIRIAIHFFTEPPTPEQSNVLLKGRGFFDPRCPAFRPHTASRGSDSSTSSPTPCPVTKQPPASVAAVISISIKAGVPVQRPPVLGCLVAVFRGLCTQGLSTFGAKSQRAQAPKSVEMHREAEFRLLSLHVQNCTLREPETIPLPPECLLLLRTEL